MKELRIEASVMTSLHELRAIEQQRIEDERAAIEQARAAEVAARELAEQLRARAEQERVRAEREEHRRIEDAKIAAERDAWLRVEAHEAAERTRHAAALEEQRLVQELELRRAEVAKTRPTWMLAVTALAVASGIALGWFAIDAARDRADAADRERVAQLAAAEAQQDATASREHLEQVQRELAEIDGTLADLDRRLKAADTKAERERLQAELDAQHKHRAAVDAEIRKKKKEHDDKIRAAGFDARECSKTPLGCMDDVHH